MYTLRDAVRYLPALVLLTAVLYCLVARTRSDKRYADTLRHSPVDDSTRDVCQDTAQQVLPEHSFRVGDALRAMHDAYDRLTREGYVGYVTLEDRDRERIETFFGAANLLIALHSSRWDPVCAAAEDSSDAEMAAALLVSHKLHSDAPLATCAAAAAMSAVSAARSRRTDSAARLLLVEGDRHARAASEAVARHEIAFASRGDLVTSVVDCPFSLAARLLCALSDDYWDADGKRFRMAFNAAYILYYYAMAKRRGHLAARLHKKMDAARIGSAIATASVACVCMGNSTSPRVQPLACSICMVARNDAAVLRGARDLVREARSEEGDAGTHPARRLLTEHRLVRASHILSLAADGARRHAYAHTHAHGQ